MDLAIRCARGSHLAVVETVACPLLGWAMEVGAVDLAADAVTADTRSDEARGLLDGIHFYGNNGWGPDFDKRQASRLLADLRDRGEVLGRELGKAQPPDGGQVLEVGAVRLGR
jgi:hypothetical protein